MQAARADFDHSAIGGRAVQEAGEPGERDAEGAAVIQIDPEGEFVEAAAVGLTETALFIGHSPYI